MAEVADTRAQSLAAEAGMMIIMLAAAPAGASERLEGPLALAEVLAGDLIRLADGRTVRLAGIRVPADTPGDPSAQRFAQQAQATLRRLLDGQMVTLLPAGAPYDRYRRVVAHVERADGLW